MRSITIGATLLTAVLLLSGCAGSPSVSGFPILNTRVVRVGEVVEIRIPTDAAGQRRWRVTAFDSSYLAAAGRSDVAGAPPDGDVVFLARARREGETTVQFTERLTAAEAAAGRAPGTSTITIRIIR